MAKVCSECGKEVKEKAVVCVKCGCAIVENTLPDKEISSTGQESGKSVAGLILGIISLVAWIFPLFGFPVSIVGLVFSAKESKNSAQAKAGLITSIIGLSLTAINSISGVILIFSGLLP